jgi:SAM-dependent methyltransferase
LSQELVFDQDHYQALNTARGLALRQLLPHLRIALPSAKPTAIDVACGTGYFSNVLCEVGFDVLGVDVRATNVAQARSRFPSLKFAIADAEELQLMRQGTFDLVLCFGLLYHLENPFRVIRNLRSLADKILVVESMCAPGDDPSMQLLDESDAADQGLNYVAFYPTESCIVKMLFRAEFPFVYGITIPPDHRDFREEKLRRRARTMLVASNDRLNTTALRPLQEPIRPLDIWSVRPTSWRRGFSRVACSVRKFKSWVLSSSGGRGKT